MQQYADWLQPLLKLKLLSMIFRMIILTARQWYVSGRSFSFRLSCVPLLYLRSTAGHQATILIFWVFLQDSHSYFPGNSPVKWAYLNASQYFLSHHFQFSSPQRVFYLHLVATLEFLTHLLTIGDTSDPSTGIYLHPPSMAAHSLRASSPRRCTISFRYDISDLLQY